MEKVFKDALKFLALLCAILFVVTTGGALILYNAETRLFNASLYIEALESQEIYDRLPVLAAESLAVSPESNDTNSPRTYLNLLPVESWETVFRALLPPEVSRPMAEQALHSVIDYLNGQSETAYLSLAGFKTHLSGAAGSESLLAVLRAQPACTLEQIVQVTVGSLFGEPAGFVLCNPSDELLDLFQPLLQAQMQTIASTIPDSLDLTPDVEGTVHPLDGLRSARMWMRISPYIPVGLLLLITLFAVRDLRGWLRWWGYPILLGGILGIFVSAIIGPMFQWAFSLLILPRLPDFLPASVLDTIRDLITAVLSGVTSPVLFQSSILVFIGIIMTLTSHLKKPSDRAQEFVRRGQ